MGNTQRVKINSNSSKLVIENEHGTELGILEFYPTDVNLPYRLKEGWKNIEKLLNEAGERCSAIKDDNAETFAVELKELDEQVKTQMDYIFDTNISEVFGNTNFLTPTKSGFLIENIMNGIIPFIEKEIKAAQASTAKHVNKYTQRYHK